MRVREKCKIFLACVLGAVFLLAGCGKNILTHTDKEKGYKIDYNADWEKEEVDISVVFSSPKESEDDTFRAAVNVVVQDLSSMSMTLEELTDHMKDYLAKANATIERSGSETLGGKSGYLLVVTGKRGELELKMMQIYAVANNRAYIISYTAEADKYDKYLEEAEKMIKSFEIL